ncbi:type VII secretion protein EccCa [Streptomyces sp. H27-D2]|uniref:type VII secretion protein EccCa n=1 Tax=Streptomyces sp. H27-D2 TaxID=3046304 RepID=UPI002DB5B2E9|nr:type VII secretion protein EccCa [Streptomyces sp. H27-D2]MEC4020225.1 type VII secretion protein EccCa [Streptomyces sp. H27-D2]
MPQGELSLQEPPSVPEAQSAMGNMITYMPMALSSLGMVLIFLRPGQGGGGPLMYVAIGLMSVSAIGMLVSQIIRASGDRKRALRSERRDYLRYLSISRRRIRKLITQQKEAQAWRHPEPVALWSLVRTGRLWERRATHDDFAEIRLAVGEQQLGMKLAPLSTKPVEDLEPLCAHALRRFIRAYGTVPDQPVALYLRTYAKVLAHGDAQAARGMVRALLGQLSVLHAPQDLRIVVVADHDRRDAWEWVKWLPHAQHPSDTDGAGAVRLVTDTAAGLEQLIGPEFAGRPPFDPDAVPSAEEPYYVIVLDNPEALTDLRLGAEGYRNAVTLDVGGAFDWLPGRHSLRLRVAADKLEMVRTDRSGKETSTTLGRPDRLGPKRARALAAMLSPYQMGITVDTGEALTSDVQLTTLLGVPDLHSMDVDQLREDRPDRSRLRVPLGVSGDGNPVELDIKESAQGGMGPHGMLIGATGSGKSELLRTLVLALALTHSSEKLNLVLVDFKGGATFLGLDGLPHTSAVITNLADESALVERMQDALHGELMRRQELLRSAGNYTSALDYEAARAAGADLLPLPTLFVVVDEFSELLSAHRDFMDLFVMIGRLGRSLGVHLLLASQRLDEGRMHQLESHLSYRIALRTFSAMESRGVLGVPDAYQLPSVPGSAILKKDTGTLVRFKAAYVSGAYRSTRRVRQSVIADQVVPYSTKWIAPRALPLAADPEPEEEASDSLLTVAVARMRDAGPPAHPVWLPPLDVPPSLDALLPQLEVHPERGLTTSAADTHAKLAVPVGIVDRPFEQAREPLMADLAGAGGHIGIAGGPQSGKSTLLRSLVLALALTHTPREVQFYCLDFGGGALGGLRDLPHVGGVTGRLDLERVHRTLAEIHGLIARREKQFADLGLDSMADLRTRRAAGELPDEPYGDVFLVVDGWGTVRQDFMDIMDTFTTLASRGLNYGVHLVIASTRWAEIGTALRDQLGTRFELRLGDSMDSMVNMRAAATVPKAAGRGMTETKHHFLTALPRLDGSGNATDLGVGVADAVERIAGAWDGPRAPQVRTLPAVLDAAELPAAQVADGDLRMPLGLEGNQLGVFWHDFAQTPHLVVVGDAETGKTNLLRSVCRTIAERYDPSEARIMLVDYRRNLLESVPDSHRLGYAVSVDVLKQVVDGVSRAMKERLPGPDITPAQLKRHDWWEGPQVFLVIDDYDMVTGGSMSNHFGPLLDYLAQGAELGLHLIVARSANGASRAMSDPLLRRLMEVNTPAALLSCPPSEGYLFNDTKPRQLPVGRAQLITRRGIVQLQTALLGEEAVAAPAEG